MGSVPLALVAPLAVSSLDVVSILVADGPTLTFLVDEIGGKGLRIGQAGHAGPDPPLPFADLVALVKCSNHRSLVRLE